MKRFLVKVTGEVEITDDVIRNRFSLLDLPEDPTALDMEKLIDKHKYLLTWIGLEWGSPEYWCKVEEIKESCK
jgi:hypothetical protein